MAFEMTAEDVESVVVHRLGVPKTTPLRAYWPSWTCDKIVEAALRGDALKEKTEHAYQEKAEQDRAARDSSLTRARLTRRTLTARVCRAYRNPIVP